MLYPSNIQCWSLPEKGVLLARSIGEVNFLALQNCFRCMSVSGCNAYYILSRLFLSPKRFYLGSHHCANRMSHGTSLFATIFTMIQILHEDMSGYQHICLYILGSPSNQFILSLVSLLLLSFILTRHVHYPELAPTSRVLPHTKAIVAFQYPVLLIRYISQWGKNPSDQGLKGNAQKTWPLVYGSIVCI